MENCRLSVSCRWEGFAHNETFVIFQNSQKKTKSETFKLQCVLDPTIAVVLRKIKIFNIIWCPSCAPAITDGVVPVCTWDRCSNSNKMPVEHLYVLQEELEDIVGESASWRRHGLTISINHLYFIIMLNTTTEIIAGITRKKLSKSWRMSRMSNRSVSALLFLS